MPVFRLLFAGAFASLLSVSPALADVHVAVVGPMTGQYASLGMQMKLGAMQAVADLNAHGGVLGQQVVLEVGDDGCDPAKAVSTANQMAAKGVVMVDGHYCSGSSIPSSHVYAAEGILEISPASTNPDYTDQGSWNTFRLCGRDDQQGQVAAQFLADRYKGGRIAVIDDTSSYVPRPGRPDPARPGGSRCAPGPVGELHARTEGLFGACRTH